MPVDRVNGPPPTEPARRSEQGSRGPRSAGASGPQTDRIEVSADARLLASLVRAALELPAVRATEVERLRDAVAAGAYEVDPRALARAILEFEDGLGD